MSFAIIRRGILSRPITTAPVTFLTDTFTDIAETLLQSHTSDSGATWTKHTGATSDAKISDANRVRGDTGVGIYYSSAIPPSAEYEVEAVIKIFSTSSSSGPVARLEASTISTFYQLRYSATQWELLQVVNNVFTTLGTWAETLVSGDVRTAKLVVTNTDKLAYIDGVLRISSSTNVIASANRAGIRAGAATNSTAEHIDSIIATTL